MKKVQLIARVAVNEGGLHTPQVAVAYHPNGRIKVGHAVIGGKEVRVHEIRNYYLRFTDNGKRQTVNVGDDPSQALVAAERKEAELRAKKFGIAVAAPMPVGAPVPQSRVRLADAAEKYLEEIKTHKRPKTYDSYRRAVEMFRDGCKVEFVDQIGRDCVMNFKAACSKKWASQDTVKNFFAYVVTFLNRNGKKGLVGKTDWPKVERIEYDPYSPDDYRKMVAACKTDKERVLLVLAWGTGFRKSEIVYAEKSDINFDAGEIQTRSKPEYGFKIKDSEQRILPANDELLAALKSYVGSLTGKLLFPRKDGKPDVHIDRVVKRIANRAGVKVPHKPDHAFRVAYACSLCREGVDIYTIQRLLGHSDIETTQGYLRAVGRQDPALRAAVNRAGAAK